MNIEHALTHDPSALLAHGPFLTSVARALVGDEHAAEDAVQETWVQLLKRKPHDEQRLTGWLSTVTANFARRFARNEAQRLGREQRAARPEALESTAKIVEQESVRREVLGAVLELAEPYRETLILRFYDDLPPREVAQQLGVPVETVRTRTRRGIEQLRERLDRNYGDREAWAKILIPIAAGTKGGTWIALGGVLAVASKCAIAAAVVAILAIAWFTKSPAGSPGWESIEPALTTRTDDRREFDLAAESSAHSARVAGVIQAVAGRVISTTGDSIAGALVQVLEPSSGVQPGFVRTGTEGRFRFECDAEVESLRLGLSVPDTKWVVPANSERSAKMGDEGVEFVVSRAPQASVLVRAVETPSGRALRDFEAALWRTDTKNYFVGSGQEGEPAVIVVDLHPDLERTAFKAFIRGSEDLARFVELGPGERREIVFEVPVEQITVQVVDLDGHPVEAALVFFGDQVDLRGDEPFKPARPERIQGGARTDAEGRCQLQGAGREVSVYHPMYSSTTVPLERSAVIRLDARGTLRGQLLNAHGLPLSGLEIALDRTRKSPTDAEGRFQFDGVEAGVRSLQVPGSDVWAYLVVVASGQTAEVQLRPWSTTTLVSVDIPPAGAAMLMALDDFGAAKIVEFDSPAIEVQGLPPAEYLLVSSEMMARATVVQGTLEFSRGSAALTVRSAPGLRVYVTPGGQHEQVEVISRRVNARLVPSSGKVRFEGLWPGSWVVRSEHSGEIASVELIEGDENEVQLD